MIQETAIAKLTRGEINQYGLSDLLSLSNSQNNGLNEAMQVLKRLT